MSAIAGKVATKFLKGRAEQYEPPDPHYEYTVDERGKKQKKKRPVPPGLSKRDAKALKKIRKRAHYLDKGMSICGFRVGWTFFIGIIPGAGDIVDALLNYTLVYRPSKKLDLPSDLSTRMLLNNMVSIGFGVVPLVGDIALAAWKANSRNANLLEAFLTIRGQEYLASINQGVSAIPVGGAEGVTADQLRQEFLRGYGATDMEQHAPAVGTAGTNVAGHSAGQTAAPALPSRQR